jgi:hypothetical protein
VAALRDFILGMRNSLDGFGTGGEH